MPVFLNLLLFVCVSQFLSLSLFVFFFLSPAYFLSFCTCFFLSFCMYLTVFPIWLCVSHLLSVSISSYEFYVILFPFLDSLSLSLCRTFSLSLSLSLCILSYLLYMKQIFVTFFGIFPAISEPLTLG
jgi:hypothetical protein